jgi:hypothetical protein
MRLVILALRRRDANHVIVKWSIIKSEFCTPPRDRAPTTTHDVLQQSQWMDNVTLIACGHAAGTWCGFSV